VIKTPLLLHPKKEPEQLRDLIGYSFFEMEGDMPVEFSPDVVPAKDPRYWTVLRRLAWDISTLLAVVKGRRRLTLFDMTALALTFAYPVISEWSRAYERARFESEYIAAVVAQHNGRNPEAAKTLGIQRSNLYRKMRHLHVRPNPRRSRRQP